MAASPEDKVLKTTCENCHVGCGLLVYVRDGRAYKIEGDPDHPLNEGAVCPKGLAQLQINYDPARLKYPLKRVGGRGEGKWQRISWDEAIDTIASKLVEVRKKYGPEYIVGTRGGQPGRRSSHAIWTLIKSLGSPNVSWTDADFCWGPIPTAEYFTVGRMYTEEQSADLKNADCILIWGANPVNTHPTAARHVMQARSRGAKLIVVDPRLTQTASKANLWLQIRPGTDGALALGMLNIIINEGLYDKAFVDKWCKGFDELKRRVQEYPVEKVSDITWIPAGDIIKAARMYATTKPACLYVRNAPEMIYNSTQACRAIACILGISGNLEKKGGNVAQSFPSGLISYFFYGDPKYRFPAELEEKRFGAKEFPLAFGPRSWRGPFHTVTMIRSILTGKPFEPKAMIVTNNLRLNHPNSKEVEAALKKIEFLVVWEIFMTPTARLSDIVLPAATWLELTGSYQPYTPSVNILCMRQPVVDPPGECWDEMKIALEILKRTGDKVIHDPNITTVQQYEDWFLKGMGMTYEDLREKAYMTFPPVYNKHEKAGFSTPTGKVELYSATFKEFGYDPLPHYVEPFESPISQPELAKEYPLILSASGQHIAYFHSLGHTSPWLRELLPDAHIEMNPATAAELGVKEGDWVWVEVPRGTGRIKRRAKLDPGIHPKTVFVPGHFWYPEKTDCSFKVPETNINDILPAEPFEEICGSTVVRGLLCKVYKD
jgi:anaerobic selenocysteine-containing dehydrogenase